jgi:alpha-glucosidase
LEYHDATGQYYYHAFLAQQPDLNGRNPDVREAIYEVMRFWLRKGVDGFRVDVIWHLIKDAEFRDNPPNPNYHKGRPPHERILTQYSTDRPEVHEIIAEMRRVTEEFGSRVLIGEIYLPLHRLVAYYGNDLAGAHMPFNFALRSTLWRARSIEGLSPITRRRFRRCMAELGARQSRSSQGRKPGRARAGAGCRDAAIDPARNADALLWR